MRVMLKTPIETLALIIETAYDTFDDEGEPDDREDILALETDEDDDEADSDEEAAAEEDDDADWEEAEAGDIEFAEILSELSGEERAELLALAWIGNGEFDVGGWDEALAKARGAGEQSVLDSLLEMPDLGDALEDGLDALGYTVAVFDDDEEPPR